MQDMTEGPISGHIMRMAVPIGVGMVFQTLYYLVDLYFVAQLGDTAIAGVSAAGNVQFLVMAITQVLGVGTMALIAQASGKKDRDDANLIFNQSLVLAAVFATVTLVGGYGLAKAYMGTLGANAETVTAGITYLYWFLPGLGLQFASLGIAQADEPFAQHRVRGDPFSPIQRLAPGARAAIPDMSRLQACLGTVGPPADLHQAGVGALIEARDLAPHGFESNRRGDPRHLPLVRRQVEITGEPPDFRRGIDGHLFVASKQRIGNAGKEVVHEQIAGHAHQGILERLVLKGHARAEAIARIAQGEDVTGLALTDPCPEDVPPVDEA